ncbi:Chlorophenol O-methyltransferase [Cladobotryum mycophilum]|uniref:Chlorophenol O-methyltransferase n=1 Tax=Cladobotryum mycophilum TaxID=491253 RepID=A0ABR0SH48_9HYPO
MRKFRVPSWLPGSKHAVNGTADADEKSTRKSLSKVKSQEEPQIKQNGASSNPGSHLSSESRMVMLAEKIRIETEKLDAYLKLNGLPEPGFEANAPADFSDLPKEIQKSRREIIFATKELSSLASGPAETLRWTAWNCLDSLSLQIINDYGIAKLVPVETPIALAELQTKTTLDPVNLARVLRHAMTNRIFQEPSPGFIAHTAASRLLAEDQTAQDWVGFNCEEVFPASGHVLQALREHPEAISLDHTGFNYAFGTQGQEPMFVTLGKNPVRAKRFGGAMANLTGGEGYEVSYLVDNCDLSAIDEKGGTFVDIGGSHGFVTVELARRWKKTKFIVQDLPKTVESAPKPICEDEAVSSRIKFQTHDFFKEQPVKDADAYFFRWIIHNYSAAYAVAILRNLIPALKPGARIIISEHCLLEPGQENPWDEKLMRGMDMVMMALLNAEERDERGFRKLFETADARFEFKGVQRVENCRMSVVEAVWNPERIEAEKTAEDESS